MADAGANCGRCEKCIRTYLNFRAVAIANPECFDIPISDDALDTIEITNVRGELFMRDLAHAMMGKAELSELMSKIERQLTRYDALRATRPGFRSKHAWPWVAAKLWSRLRTIHKTE